MNKILAIFNFFKAWPSIKKGLKKFLGLFNWVKKKITNIVIDLKNKPYKFIILILLALIIPLFIFFFKNFFKSEQVLTNNTYSIALEEQKTRVIRAEVEGTVEKLNEKINLYLKYPNTTVIFEVNEEIIKLNSSFIENEINKIRQKFPQITGLKSIIQEEVIEQPNEIELLKLKSEINTLKIKKEQLIINLVELERKYYQAQNLFDQKVITASKYEETVTLYFNTKKELEVLEVLIQDLEHIYQEKHKPNKKNKITITTIQGTQDSEELEKWLLTQDKEIRDIFKKASKLIIKSPNKVLLKETHVKFGDKVKVGTPLLTVIDYDSLKGYIKLKKEDIKLIKSEKAKIYFVNQSTSTKLEIQNYSLEGNKLSFPLIHKEMINNYRTAKILIERENNE